MSESELRQKPIFLAEFNISAPPRRAAERDHNNSKYLHCCTVVLYTRVGISLKSLNRRCSRSCHRRAFPDSGRMKLQTVYDGELVLQASSWRRLAAAKVKANAEVTSA